MTFFERISNLNLYESFKARTPIPLPVGLPRTCASIAAGHGALAAFTIVYGVAAVALSIGAASADKSSPEAAANLEKIIIGLPLIPASIAALAGGAAAYMGCYGSTNLFLAAYPSLGQQSSRLLVGPGIRPQFALMTATAILDAAYVLYQMNKTTAPAGPGC